MKGGMKALKDLKNIIKKKDSTHHESNKLVAEDDGATTTVQTTTATTTNTATATPENSGYSLNNNSVLVDSSETHDEDQFDANETLPHSQHYNPESTITTPRPSSAPSTTNPSSLRLVNAPVVMSELFEPPIYMPDFDDYNDPTAMQKDLAGVRRDTHTSLVSLRKGSLILSPIANRKSLIVKPKHTPTKENSAPLLNAAGEPVSQSFITNFDVQTVRKGSIIGIKKEKVKKEDGTGVDGVERAGDLPPRKQRKDYQHIDEDDVEDDPNDEQDKPVIIVKTLEDFGKDELAIIKRSKIEEEKFVNNLNVLVNVISFTRRKEGRVYKIENQPSRPHRDTTKIFISPGVHNIADKLTPEILKHYFEEGDPKESFKLREYEGEGGFGRVFTAKCKNPRHAQEKELVAVKIMPHKKDREIKMNLNEIAILKYCRHPNIVGFLRSYHRPSDDEVWLVLEYLEGGTLKDASRNFGFSENQIAYIAREMLQGLSYLHDNQLVHRDLKSANVMLSMKGEVKLIDFGLCFDMSVQIEETHMCGSPFWMPPEMIRHAPHSWPADIWSFAVCIVEMIKRKVPNHKSRFKAMFLVGSEGLVLDQSEMKWSDELQDFLTLCLQLDPKQRPTAKQLLQHPFISKAATLKEMQQVMPPIFLTNTMSKQGLF